MQRLADLQLSNSWKSSITHDQRRAAQALLQAHEAFTSLLDDLRHKILDEMQQAVQAETLGPQLLPGRVLVLSNHVRFQSKLHSASLPLRLLHISRKPPLTPMAHQVR